jgi:hypothetical protein
MPAPITTTRADSGSDVVGFAGATALIYQVSAVAIMGSHLRESGVDDDAGVDVGR